MKSVRFKQSDHNCCPALSLSQINVESISTDFY